ncbi:MAG: MmgE/PrpD family protein, partial [Chloroflexota bacterium]
MKGELLTAMRLTRRDLVRKGVTGGVVLALGASGGAALAVPAVNASPSSEGASLAHNGLTHYVAEFVVNTTYADIPTDAIEVGKKSILDGIGLALVGSVVPTGDLSRTYLNSLGLSAGRATVAGSSMKVSPRFAAFANGVGIHSEDYDDTQASGGPHPNFGLLHPTNTTLPVAMALGEEKGVSGRDLMLAYQLGVEVGCKVCQAINPRHYIDGFHTTGTCGTFGAATVASKLHGFDAHWTANVYGIAGAEASGLRANFGTMTKPFQAGHAAESGVIAAALSALGWTASLDVLEDSSGFFRAAGGGYDPKQIMGKLGSPWSFIFPGVSIKPFPSGLVTHPGMTEMLNLIKERHIHADQIESVTVGVNHYVPKDLFYHDPHTALEGKFSMEFC